MKDKKLKNSNGKELGDLLDSINNEFEKKSGVIV